MTSVLLRLAITVPISFSFFGSVQAGGLGKFMDDANPIKQGQRVLNEVKRGEPPVPQPPPVPPLNPSITVKPEDIVNPVHVDINGTRIDPGGVINSVAPGTTDNVNKGLRDIALKSLTWPVDVAKSAAKDLAKKVNEIVQSLLDYIIALLKENLPLAIAYIAGSLILAIAVGVFLGLAIFRFILLFFAGVVWLSLRILRYPSKGRAT